MVKVLFVCMGNICRSPTAEGVFRHLAKKSGVDNQLTIDSAGTIAYHEGDTPDGRSQAKAREHGIDLSHIRARQVRPEDFATFDFIVAMDPQNFRELTRNCPQKHAQKLCMMTDFAPQLGERSVPDPYYGDGDGFEHVFQIVKASCEGLLAHLEAEGMLKA